MTNSRPHWNVADRLSTKEAREEKERQKNQRRMKEEKKWLNLHNLLAAASPLLSLTNSFLTRRRSSMTSRDHRSTLKPSHSHSNGHFFRLRFALFDRSLAAACCCWPFFALNIQLLHRSSVEFSILSGADVLRASKLNFFFSVAVGVKLFFLFLYSTLLLWNSRVVATLGLAWVSITSLILVCSVFGSRELDEVDICVMFFFVFTLLRWLWLCLARTSWHAYVKWMYYEVRVEK